ncbi:hypothetical protein [Ruania alba]|nr:hypothetical protein [Ruania alba]
MTRRQVLTSAAGISIAGASIATASAATATDHSAAEASERVPEFWYQDNNLGLGGRGVPTDFFSRYDDLDSWALARAQMHTFALEQGTFVRQGLSERPAFLEKMAAAHAGMNFCYNVTQAVAWWWPHYNETGEVPEGPPDYTTTINHLRQLRSTGFTITDVILQSVLAKPGPGRFLGYSMERRIRDVVEFYDQVRPEFPDVRIGIIDPLPGQFPWQDAYRFLKDELRSNGHELDFIHFDKPFDRVRLERNTPHGVITWDRMVEVGEFVKNELGLTFGLQCVDEQAGKTSSNDFRKHTLEGLANYVAHGGTADRYILWPFFPHPEHSTPDDLGALPPEGASQMRIFRELARGVPARRYP